MKFFLSNEKFKGLWVWYSQCKFNEKTSILLKDLYWYKSIFHLPTEFYQEFDKGEKGTLDNEVNNVIEVILLNI